MKIKRKHYILFLLCLCLFFVFLFSSAYIAMEARHNCTGEHCPICECIHVAEQTVRQIGSAIMLLAISALLLVMISTALRIAQSVLPCWTPVSQKIRMNN